MLEYTSYIYIAIIFHPWLYSTLCTFLGLSRLENYAFVSEYLHFVEHEANGIPGIIVVCKCV